MDAFFASVEQLTRPTLRGRPVLVGGLGGRGVVAGASYEARVYGARSAMPMHQARRLVGAPAVVLPPRGVVYGVASRRVLDTVRSVVPVLEQLSFDEAFGEPAELAGDVGRPTSSAFCQACGPKSATRPGSSPPSAPDPESRSPRSPRAWPSPTASGWCGATRKPCCCTVFRCGGCGASDRSPRRSCTGSASKPSARSPRCPTPKPPTSSGATVGPALHRLARGIDDRPVAENAPAKQISAESTFPEDLTTLDQLREAAGPIGEHAHARLEKDGRGARTVTVKLKKSDMSILTRSATLPYATTDAATLIAMARRLLLDPVEIGPIRLVGVGFSGLSDVRQESLFPDLELVAEDVSNTRLPPTVTDPAATPPAWRVGDDVVHTDLRPRLDPGGGPRRDDGAVRDPQHRAGPGAHLSRRRPRHRRAPTPSTAWTGPTTSAIWRPAQPQRATTSSTGEPAAKAAITSTRACAAGSRGTTTAPASTNSLPGP